MNGGRISILHHCGRNMIRGLAPIVGPGHIWGVNGGQRRFPIGTVHGWLGWVERVLWQTQMGLGMWQSCGGQVTIIGHWGNSWKWGLVPSHRQGKTWGFTRGRGRFTIRASQRLPGWVKRVLRQIQVAWGCGKALGGETPPLSNWATAAGMAWPPVLGQASLGVSRLHSD